jgi:hypothetical protein
MIPITSQVPYGESRSRHAYSKVTTVMQAQCKSFDARALLLFLDFQSVDTNV